MKREFLLGLQAADNPLPKEIIDAIMAENGKDIQKVRAGFADYDAIKEELSQLQQTAQELQTHRENALAWEEKYNRAVEDHTRELAELSFQNRLDGAILRAKGRSAKVICALLDLDALRRQDDQTKAIEEAITALKKTSSYLFEGESAPYYAHHTGVWQGAQEKAPTTLAGALKEKFERK